jgi:hypothetical protein
MAYVLDKAGGYKTETLDVNRIIRKVVVSVSAADLVL